MKNKPNPKLVKMIEEELKGNITGFLILRQPKTDEEWGKLGNEIYETVKNYVYQISEKWRKEGIKEERKIKVRKLAGWYLRELRKESLKQK